MTTTIEATGLHKRYRNVAALDGLDLTVEEGHVVGLLGPNAQRREPEAERRVPTQISGSLMKPATCTLGRAPIPTEIVGGHAC